MAGKEFLHEDGVEVHPDPNELVQRLAGLCESHARLYHAFMAIPMPLTHDSRVLLHKIDEAMARTNRKIWRMLCDQSWLMSYVMAYTTANWRKL